MPGPGRSPGGGARYPLQFSWVSLVAQMVKNPPAVWEACVRSLGWEDPLEKGRATYSSVLAWRIPWTEEPHGLQSMGVTKVKQLFPDPRLAVSPSNTLDQPGLVPGK